MKKKVFLLAIIIATFTTSCKKETTVITKELPEVQLTPEDIESSKNAANVSTKVDTIAPVKTTTITFKTKEHDFGVIKQGSKVDYNFIFTNTGTNDLIITDAKGSCGCTVPEYPKEAVEPGGKGKIKVSFNSEGKSGKQTKSVKLSANTATGSELLTIKSTIVVDK